MSIGTQTNFQTGSVTLEVVQNFKITHINAAIANTEYSLALTNSVKQIIIKSDNQANLKYGWNSGESSTNYLSIDACSSIELKDMKLIGKTLYIQADKAGVIIVQEGY